MDNGGLMSMIKYVIYMERAHSEKNLELILIYIF